MRFLDDLWLFVERIGWKQLVFSTVLGAVLVAAGAVYVLTRSGAEGSAATTSGSTSTAESTYVYYLRAVAPKTKVNGCTMRIRFTWKPDYHADQYVGATALITTTGPGIEGTARKPLTTKGVSLDVGPVSLAGGYKIWAAKVTSVDGDPPGNDTTIQAAPPPTAKCD